MSNLEIKNIMEKFDTIAETDTLTEICVKLKKIDTQMSDIVKTIYGNYESWKKIKDYENYSVSSFGRVRNDKTDRILKPTKNAGGYYHVSLYKNGKEKNHSIHRLIGIAFLPNHDNKRMVDHIDENKMNNNIINLRWSTGSQNQFNQGKQKNNTTGFKGVCFDKSKQKYVAFININGKHTYLGCFLKAEEASQAYDKKAKEIHGEFYYKNK